MEIKRTKLLRLINKKMITLPWGVYAAPSADIREIDVTHEFIHLKQWKELWYVGFIILFAIEWIIRLFEYKELHAAYRNISLEREAYANQSNLTYLETRKRFSFIKYL